MELETNREQPFNLDKTQEEMKEILEENGGQIQEQTGSQLGKFSSPESLLEAYNNLQREFTKKCQKLSEYEKQNVDNAIVETSHSDETKEIAPAFESKEWRSQVADFLRKNEHAREFSKEISSEILKDPNLQKSSNMLEIAWSRVLAKNYKTPEQIATDNNFLQNFVLNNEEVKKQVFSNYMQTLNNFNSPNLIGSGFRGGKSTIAISKNRPNSLDDAASLALKFFKN